MKARTGLALIGAALAAGLLLGASPASATELCKAAEKECASKNVYESATTLEASTSKALIESSLGTITCESTLKGETLTSVGNPLTAEISSIAFSGCKKEAEKCTAETLNLPYFAQVDETVEGEGTFEVWGDASSTMTLSVSCSLKCKFSAESMPLKLKGGSKAELSASGAALEKGEGTSCPKTAKLTAAYTVNTPAPLQVEARPTKLCKEEPIEATCPGGQAFSGAVKGYLAGVNVAKLVGTGPEASGTVTCTESPLAGSFNSNGRGEISTGGLKFTSGGGGACTSNLNGGTPTVAITVLNLPWNRSSINFMRTTEPQGRSNFWGTRNPKLKVVVNGTECVYFLRIMFSDITNPILFGPMEMKVQWQSLRTSGPTNICPAFFEVEGNWWLESSTNENIWVGRQ